MTLNLQIDELRQGSLVRDIRKAVLGRPLHVEKVIEWTESHAQNPGRPGEAGEVLGDLGEELRTHFVGEPGSGRAILLAGVLYRQVRGRNRKLMEELGGRAEFGLDLQLSVALIQPSILSYLIS